MNQIHLKSASQHIIAINEEEDSPKEESSLLSTLVDFKTFVH